MPFQVSRQKLTSPALERTMKAHAINHFQRPSLVNRSEPGAGRPCPVLKTRGGGISILYRKPSAGVLPVAVEVILIWLLFGPVTRTLAIPAFARKYALPCSACHEAWPKLNNFGQTFKDNGYQMMNDRDAPIFQQAAYWPVAFRITPNWHRESVDRTDITNPASGGVTTEGQLTTHGFDLS